MYGALAGAVYSLMDERTTEQKYREWQTSVEGLEAARRKQFRNLFKKERGYWPKAKQLDKFLEQHKDTPNPEPLYVSPKLPNYQQTSRMYEAIDRGDYEAANSVLDEVESRIYRAQSAKYLAQIDIETAKRDYLLRQQSITRNNLARMGYATDDPRYCSVPGYIKPKEKPDLRLDRASEFYDPLKLVYTDEIWKELSASLERKP